MEATEEKKPESSGGPLEFAKELPEGCVEIPLNEDQKKFISELMEKHAKEMAVLNTRIAVLTHRWQEAESQYNDALVQINTPKE